MFLSRYPGLSRWATGMSMQRLSKLWLIRDAAALLGYAASGELDVVFIERERGRERERERERALR